MLCLPSHPFIFSGSFFPFLIMSARMVISIAKEPVTLQFPLPNVVIAADAMPTHWAFYFQGSG